MTRVLGPGPASMEGLRWLARVGPSPLDAWRSAMCWSEVAARSHARRLENQRWLARYPMCRGDGCLFVATRAGVTMAEITANVPAIPRIGSWPQHTAVAWAAAWVTVRGRAFRGRRELLVDSRWCTDLEWRDHHGYHRAAHRPSLIVEIDDEQIIAIEVELSRTPRDRIRAELLQHLNWQASGRTHGVVYICSDDIIRKRIGAGLTELGVTDPGRVLSIVGLDELKDKTLAAHERRRAERNR